jgi:hypothetical protein
LFQLAAVLKQRPHLARPYKKGNDTQRPTAKIQS